MDYCEHDINIYVPVSAFVAGTGTFTYSGNNGSPRISKTATAETAVLYIPIMPPRVVGEFGVKFKSISIPLRITTADLSAVIEGRLYRSNYYMAVADAGVNQSATAYTTFANTQTGTQVTAAATDRLFTYTLTTPDDDYTSTTTNMAYNFELRVPCAATTVLMAYDATITYSGIQ